MNFKRRVNSKLNPPVKVEVVGLNPTWNMKMFH